MTVETDSLAGHTQPALSEAVGHRQDEEEDATQKKAASADAVAPATPPRPLPLHADACLLAQPGGDLVQHPQPSGAQRRERHVSSAGPGGH